MVMDHRKDLAMRGMGWVKRVVRNAKTAVWLLVHEARITPGTDTNGTHQSFNGNDCLSTLRNAKSAALQLDYVAGGRTAHA